MAMVDFPVPPFSLPTTMTCAEAARLALACTNMTRPCYSAFATENPAGLVRVKALRDTRQVIALLPSARRRQLVRALAQRADAMNEVGLVVDPIDDGRNLAVLAGRDRRNRYFRVNFPDGGLACNQRVNRRAQPLERNCDAYHLGRDIVDALAQHRICHPLGRPSGLDLLADRLDLVLQLEALVARLPKLFFHQRFLGP